MAPLQSTRSIARPRARTERGYVASAAPVGIAATSAAPTRGVRSRTSAAVEPNGRAHAALLARTGFLLGETRASDALAALLAPYADRVVLRGTLTAHGPASYFLALTARSLGREREVSAHFEHARGFCRRMGAVGWGAQIDFDAAQWAAERGDLRGAREAATRTSRAARALGMAQLAPAAEALLDRLGR